MAAMSEQHRVILDQAIDDAASAFDLPKELLQAIAQVESGGNLFAVRYEHRYRWLWDMRRNQPYRLPSGGFVCPLDFPYDASMGSRQTEFICQRTSWGPMQIMGAVAREYGFRGFLPQLCGPLGVHFGAEHLARLRHRFIDKHGWDGVIAAYNAGSPRKGKNGIYLNQGYVSKVHSAEQR